MEEFKNLKDVSVDENPHLEIIEPEQEELNEMQKVEDDFLEEKVLEYRPIKVYVKRDDSGKIVDVNSEIFIKDFDGWEFYDEGFGDKYAHAQSQYFDDLKS